jgi:CHAD domain-containing protein
MEVEENCKTILLDYYEQSLQRVAESLAECRLNPGRKNIHNLRLALKNLKAFCLLFDAVQPRKVQSPSFTDAMSVLFSKLGDVRDYQVAVSTLNKCATELDLSGKKIKSLISSVRKDKEAELIAFLKNFDHLKELKITADRIKRFTNRETSEEHHRQAMIRFIGETIQSIRTLNGLRHTARVTHQIRTLTKTLYYIFLVLQREPWFEQAYPGLQLELINLIQVELGEWHDLIVLKEILLLIKQKERNKIKLWKLFALEDILQKTQAQKVRHIKQDLFPQLILLKA